MFRRKSVIIASLIGAFGLIVLAVPVFALSALPTLVSAQTNQCLAQDATISAMQVLVLQSTLTSLNYQATITALGKPAASGGGNVGATAIPVAGPSFNDTFADNSHGWDLTQHDWGGATISRGQLVIIAKRLSWINEYAPGLHASNYYIQADVVVLDDLDYEEVGFIVGDNSSYHLITLNSSGHLGINEWTDKLRTISDIPIDGIGWSQNKKFTIGLEAKGGLYSFYLNGQQVSSVQFKPHGDQVGIDVLNNSLQYGDTQVAFSNVTVRQSH